MSTIIYVISKTDWITRFLPHLFVVYWRNFIFNYLSKMGAVNDWLFSSQRVYQCCGDLLIIRLG